MTENETEKILREGLETIARGELVVDCAAEEYARNVLAEVAALATAMDELDQQFYSSSGDARLAMIWEKLKDLNAQAGAAPAEPKPDGIPADILEHDYRLKHGLPVAAPPIAQGKQEGLTAELAAITCRGCKNKVRYVPFEDGSGGLHEPLAYKSDQSYLCSSKAKELLEWLQSVSTHMMKLSG
jgi:hypothetical protein